MNQIDLSNPMTSILKYAGVPLMILFSFIGLLLFINTGDARALLTLIGLIPPFFLRKLMDISYDSENLIIKGLFKKQSIGLDRVKKIYRIDIGVNYRIEFLDNQDKIQYVDFWPTTNLIQATKGQLPDNLKELLDRLK